MDIINRVYDRISLSCIEKKTQRKLSSFEKLISFSGFLLLPFGVMPGLLAFWGLSLYFKFREVNKITNSASFLRINSIFKNSLNSKNNSTFLASSYSSSAKSNESAIMDILEKLSEKENSNVINDLYSLRAEVEKTFRWEKYLALIIEDERNLFFNILNNILGTNNLKIAEEFFCLMSESELLNFAKDYKEPVTKWFVNNLKELSNWPKLGNAILKSISIDEQNYKQLLQLADELNSYKIKQDIVNWIIENIDFDGSNKMNKLFKLAVKCRVKDLQKVLFEKLLSINRIWNNRECTLVKKWFGYLEVKKISEKEVASSDNLLLLISLFPEDIYAEDIARKYFSQLFKSNRKQALNNKVDHLLMKWAPLVNSLNFHNAPMDKLRILFPYFINLTSLVLSKSTIENKDIALLPRTVTHLTLTSLQKVKVESYKNLPPKLTYLSLEDCASLTDRALAFFPKSLKNLTIWDAQITGEGLSSLGQNIKYLQFIRCRNLTTVNGLTSKVESLRLHSCNVKDKGLASVPETVTNLYLINNEKFTGSGVHFPASLRRLEIAGSPKLIQKLDLPAALQVLHINM